MEEWRKGWHPENIAPKGDSGSVLIVGSGPAGLEAARALGKRGYDVAIAEAGGKVGGRVARERLLPGLSAWGRVADYREYQISQMPNVETYFDSQLTADQVLEFGFDHVCLATGSSWSRDGAARWHVAPMAIASAMKVLNPDDLMAGHVPTGDVVIFDDDHYYMGGVLAELCANNGAKVTIVTSAPLVSEWTVNTLEQAAIHKRLVEAGVTVMTSHAVASAGADHVTTECVFSGQTANLKADALVLVADRRPEEALWQSLKARKPEWAEHGVKSIKVIGDAEAPGPIAWATYAGHRYARELDEPGREAIASGDELSFRREVTALA